MINISISEQTGKHLLQLVRYGLVGLSVNLASYLIYLLITHIGAEPKSVMTILYITGTLLGFAGHRKWTFVQNGAFLAPISRYFIAHFFGYLINFFLLFTFVDKLGYPHQWVQALSIMIVAVFLFIVFKYFVFREQIPGT